MLAVHTSRGQGRRRLPASQALQRPLDGTAAHLCAVGCSHGRFCALQRHLAACHSLLGDVALDAVAPSASVWLLVAAEGGRKRQSLPWSALLCMPDCPVSGQLADKAGPKPPPSPHPRWLLLLLLLVLSSEAFRQPWCRGSS